MKEEYKNQVDKVKILNARVTNLENDIVDKNISIRRL